MSEKIDHLRERGGHMRWEPNLTPRERALKALRVPDLEWAYDLVHTLAHDVLATTAELEKRERREVDVDA